MAFRSQVLFYSALVGTLGAISCTNKEQAPDSLSEGRKPAQQVLAPLLDFSPEETTVGYISEDGHFKVSNIPYDCDFIEDAINTTQLTQLVIQRQGKTIALIKCYLKNGESELDLGDSKLKIQDARLIQEESTTTGWEPISVGTYNLQFEAPARTKNSFVYSVVVRRECREWLVDNWEFQ